MNLKKMMLASIMVASMFAGAACNKDKGTPVTIWVSETAGVAAKTKEQVKRFAAQEGLKLDVTVEGVTESNSATQMLTDVEAGADIYCFAQDQFARLVQGGALSKLGQAAAAEVVANNDEGTVAASKSGDSYYAYPLTSDNGYFMYYDKAVITNEDHLTDIAQLVADCEAAGKNFSMEVDTSGWYLASWFFAVDDEGNHICKSEWATDDEGKFVSVNDTFNSDNGVIAAQGIKQLTSSSSFVSSSKCSDFAAATPSAIVISGTWDYNAAKDALGDNLGIAELPSFTVGGETYHLGSFSGCKLMGVKPSEDVERSALMHKIARYLTSEECQLERFNSFGWGPSNKNALANETVAQDAALAALVAQNAYAIPQGQIHGSWWDIANALGKGIEDATNEAGIRAALATYDESIDAVLNMSDDEAEAFTVIGKLAGANWDTDIAMTQDPVNKVWKTNYPFELKEGDAFKIRQGKSWDVAYPAADYAVSAAEAGWNTIKLDYSGATPTVVLEKIADATGFGVCGTNNSWGATADAVLTADEEHGNLYVSEPISFAADGEFKVRFNNTWGIEFADNGNNFKVTTAGDYVITLNVLTGVVTYQLAA